MKFRYASNARQAQYDYVVRREREKRVHAPVDGRVALLGRPGKLVQATDTHCPSCGYHVCSAACIQTRLPMMPLASQPVAWLKPGTRLRCRDRVLEVVKRSTPGDSLLGVKDRKGVVTYATEDNIIANCHPMRWPEIKAGLLVQSRFSDATLRVTEFMKDLAGEPHGFWTSWSPGDDATKDHYFACDWLE